ncbi:unnamed protein product, partial [Durusdinium trenchii]
MLGTFLAPYDVLDIFPGSVRIDVCFHVDRSPAELALLLAILQKPHVEADHFHHAGPGARMDVSIRFPSSDLASLDKVHRWRSIYVQDGNDATVCEKTSRVRAMADGR